nr:immunity 49 family protein [Vibrio neptunius]
MEYRGAELIFDIDGRIKRSNNVKFEVMKTVHQHDQEAYRKAMYRALEMHKEWWTHDEDFSQRVQGYISLPLLTAAKYAYEKHGFTLDFECGYLPSYIYLS